MVNNIITTVEKQFVTYEIAKGLKDLGFNELCFGKFNRIKELVSPLINRSEYDSQVNYEGMTLIDAPLWQQAIDWIREKYNININITENPYTQGNGDGLYEWNIKPIMIKNQPLPQPRGLGSGCGTSYDTAKKEAILNSFSFIKSYKNK